MSFTEYTVQLMLGQPRNYYTEVHVDLDTNTKKPLDIYTYRQNYKSFPADLKKLTWKTDRNPLFIHVIPKDRTKAWAYQQEHAILDDELEALLR
jgi:hypothetical protein